MPDEARGNIQQRVFDCTPVYPSPIPVHQFYRLLPYFDRRSIQNALATLVRLNLIELVPNAKFSYRRKEGAQRPEDGRGWPKGKPKP